MQGTLVVRMRTPLSMQDIREALIAGDPAMVAILRSAAVVGDGPASVAMRNRLAMAVAQLALEHARGAAVWNHNLGNIDADPTWSGAWFALTASEVFDGHPAVITKRLRAHCTAQEGAEDYWRFLHEHYAPALSAFDMGAPIEAATRLKALHYYTGSLAVYGRTLQSIYDEIRPGIDVLSTIA